MAAGEISSLACSQSATVTDTDGTVKSNASSLKHMDKIFEESQRRTSRDQSRDDAVNGGTSTGHGTMGHEAFRNRRAPGM